MDASTQTAGVKGAISVRRVRADDVLQVCALDERITKVAKPNYWQDIYERYGKRRLNERFFLVAESDETKFQARILGFIVGEMRAWEFGSEPCGWVFALSVEPRTRLRGIGQSLFDAISFEFKNAGVAKMRTMVARSNRLHLMFFRSEEMVAGPYIQLEKELN